MILRSILISLLILMTLLAGCSSKPYSQGRGGSLVVVADPLDRPVIRGAIESRFGRIIHTPQPESSFQIHWVDARSFADHTRNPLVILAATLDGEGETAELLGKMVSGKVREGVVSGQYEIFRREDPWARRQLLAIVVGRNQHELGSRMTNWVDSLHLWFSEFEYNRLQHEIFRRSEQKALAKELTEKHAFRLRIQQDYFLTQDNDSLNFIRMIRHAPERWLMVGWGNMSDSTRLTPQFIYNRRKLLGNVFLDPVTTYDENWNWETTTLNGSKAVRVNGLWATTGPNGGGPFFTYGIWDADQLRYYLIDGAVFAPGMAKMPYLWRLNAVAQTFQVE